MPNIAYSQAVKTVSRSPGASHRVGPTLRFAAALIAAGVLLGACEKAVGPETYDQVQTGMSYAEVKKILGEGELQDGSGFSISSGGLVGQGSGGSSSTQKVYLWRDAGREISITFKDGKVDQKNKVGF